MAQDTSPQKVGSPDDVTNVNPLTDRMFARQHQMLGDMMSGINATDGQIQQALSGLSQLGQMAPLMGQQFSPEAGASYLLAQAPEMQALVQHHTSPFVQAQDALTRRMMGQVGDQVSGQFAGQGAAHSGAHLTGLAQAMGDIGLQSQAQIEGLRQQQLAQQMGMLPQMWQTGAQTSLTGLGFGLDAQQAQLQSLAQQQALRGQLGGQALQGMTAYGAPEWWQPTWMAPGGGGNFLSGAMGGAGAMAPTGNKWAIAGGAALGGLGGAMGW